MIYCIAIYYKLDNNNAFRTSMTYNLKNYSYFYRNQIKNFMHLVIREAVKSCDINENFITLNHNHPQHNYKINIMTTDNIYFYIIITDLIYNTVIARKILYNLSLEFVKLQNNNIIQKHIVFDTNIIINCMNDYMIDEHEKINKIKLELNEVSNIMKNNINNILERDVKIQDILQKTENLSKQSEEFKKATIKLNRCCLWF